MSIQEFGVSFWRPDLQQLRLIVISILVCAWSVNGAAQTEPESSVPVSEDGQGQKAKASNPLERAIELNANGMFAEAASSFDDLHQQKPDLAILLRAGIAWYQGGFLAAAEDRFQQWLKTAEGMGDTLPERMSQQRTAVESLLKKVRVKVFTVPVEVPEDVYRPRAEVTSLTISKMADGFAPAPIVLKLTPEVLKNQKSVRLDAGRWLFEFAGARFQKQPEIIEVYDDSPLMLSPIPSSKMLPKATPVNEKLAYREALDLFRSGDFRVAVKTLIELVPEGLSADESLWLYARSNEKNGSWKDAADAYRRLISAHPSIVDAKMIQAKLPSLDEKATAAMARVTFVTMPEGGQITLSRMKNPIEYSVGDKLHPGDYQALLRWETGVESTHKFTVKAREDQTITLESQKAMDAQDALRWHLDGFLHLGFGLLSGNQSELIETSVGPALLTGLNLGWALSEELSVSSGLAYIQSRPNFEVKSSGAGTSTAGHWVFNHVRVPVGVAWLTKYQTEVVVETGIDALVYASEGGESTENISSLSAPISPIAQLSLRHPLSILGEGFKVAVSYHAQLGSLTKTDSALRLQQISLGLTHSIF